MARPVEGGTLTVTSAGDLDAIREVLVGVDFARDSVRGDEVKGTVTIAIERKRGMYRGSWVVRFLGMKDWRHERNGDHATESVAKVEWDGGAKRLTLPMVMDRITIDVDDLRIELEDRTPGRLSREERLDRVPDDIREWREEEDRKRVALQDQSYEERKKIAVRSGLTQAALTFVITFIAGWGSHFVPSLVAALVIGTLTGVLVFRRWDPRTQGFVIGIVALFAMFAAGGIFFMVFFGMLIIAGVSIAIGISARQEEDLVK